jgi:cell wall-associated NlpC family hydrolase
MRGIESENRAAPSRSSSEAVARQAPSRSSSEAVARQAFVAEARSWLGTPFRDQGDVKGKNGAVDCAMLLVKSAAAVGLIDPDFDPRPYPPQWLLHKDEEKFLAVIDGIIAARGCGANVHRAPIPGDVIVYRVARCFAHGAIVVENGHIVHAYYKTGQVALSSLNEVELAFLPDGRPRPFKLYDLWLAPA